jgi:Fe-S cluster biogenesis protein NfuA
MDLGLRLHAERTPNPNSVKWVLSRPLLPAGRSAHFEESPPAAVSPLAAKLFAVPGVVCVFLAPTFVTVTKSEDVDWTELARPLVDAIRAFAESGEAALGPDFEHGSDGPQGAVEARIRGILDREIRPAVSRDGGDVLFAGYRDGVVELYLQGSCSGCPSSLATLKLGIEARLREEIPEVTEVVAI